MPHESHLAPGEIAVPEKASETTAIPELPVLIDVKGDIAAIGAMGCQKAAAEKIFGKKAGQGKALKESQRGLCEDARLYFGEFRQEMKPVAASGNGHGRIELREYRLLPAASRLRKEWKGLKALRADGLALKGIASLGLAELGSGRSKA